jgi:hypothetical protein
MKLFSAFLVLTALSASCGEKKEEEDSVVKATMPDGTEVELNKDRLYADSKCEVDNVLTSTYRKNWFSVSGDKLYIWGVVFFDDTCDTAKDHVVFGSPISWTLKDFDGSKGAFDIDEDQTADYEITVSDDQLGIHPLFEAEYAEDESFAKAETAFSFDKMFDFSLDVTKPVLTSTHLQLDFTVALTTDDFLVNGASYLKSIYAEISCKLANGSTVRPRFSDATRENKLDGAGPYSASAVLTASQKGVAVTSCEVFLERIYESSDAGSSGWEVKSMEITIE